MIFNWQSNKTQERFSLLSIPPALFPYIPTEPIWFIWVVVAVLSMRWAKGTLGNFMIHDEASWIILDVCMCHCILIMAPVSWKHRHTFRGDHLIFSSLILPLLSTLANTLPLNSSQRSHRLHCAPWLYGNTKEETGNDRWSQADQKEISCRFRTVLRKINTALMENLFSSLSYAREVVTRCY